MRFFEKLNCFYRAVENESALDLQAYEQLNLKPQDYFYLPKVVKWYPKLPMKMKEHTLISLLTFLALSFSVALLGWVYIVYCFVKSLFVDSVNFNPHGDTLVFANGERNLQVIGSSGFLENKLTYISFRKINGRGKNVFQVKDCTVFLDKINSLFISLFAYVGLLTSFKLSRVNQFYYAYEFFLTLNLFVKIQPSNIVTSHHYDRWSILMDSYSGYSSREVRDKSKFKFTLIQHGMEREDHLRSRQYLGPFNKHKNVSVLYVLSVAQSDLFTRYILDPVFCSDVEIIVFSEDALVLTPVFSGNDLPCVLIIGHPIYDFIQVELYRALVTRFQVNCFYKPHPTAPLSRSSYNHSVGWKVVIGDEYPDIDYFISYQSTLALQYEAMGKSGFIHGESQSLDDTVELMVDFFLGKI